MAQDNVTYKGDTFRNLIRQYSNSRMERDGSYRRGVEKLMEERRKAQKEDAND